MIKRFILALLCFVVLATAWEAESCDSKEMKEAIAEAEVKIKSSMGEVTYNLKKAMKCMSEADGRNKKIALTLFGQDTTQKVYVHKFIYRHIYTGDYQILSETILYQKSVTDHRKLPFDGVPV